jgi:2-polyprenyl-6-methoxyphenol hydroxylase-like FAD-dependent oxidoreductase
MSEPVVDVAIVGYGPVGNALAILLAQYGHTVTVLERWPEPYPMPRAVHFDDEVARILQSCGIGESLGAISEPADVYEWRNAKGTPLVRFGSVGMGRNGWPPSSMFNQPALEARLESRVGELPSITVRRGVEAVAVSQDVDGVTISARDRDGAAVDVRSRYAVGCDGANSTIRQLLDIPSTDLGFFYDWLIVDVILNEPRVYDPINVQVCDPSRPTTAVSGGPGRRRWEFMRLPTTLERHAVYTFSARHAEQWRRGRVLLAGDAAHLMPPFAGQGMCSGIRDAANLAWKLDTVLAGRSSAAILDSYEEERLPHARGVIDLSIELGKIICVPDPAEAAARDEIMSAGMTGDRTSIPPLPPLASSLLPTDDRVAGHVLPQGRVVVGDDLRRFDDANGVGWRLVTVSAESLDVETTLAAWFAAERGTIVIVTPEMDVDGTWADWFAEHECTWALQRPDFHVHGVASDRVGAAALLADLHNRLTNPIETGE